MKRIISLILSVIFVLSVSPLAIAEEEPLGENLCIGKEAYSDAVYLNGADFAPIFAIDGDVNTRAITANSSVSDDIRSGFENYILVDLGEVYELNRVIVRSRRDSTAGWARRDFAAWLANKEDFSDAVMIGRKDTDGDFGSDLDMPLKNYRARYIIVANQNGMHKGMGVSEIEAYGNAISNIVIPTYSDVSDTLLSATNLLFATGVMEGISTKEFGADLLITRGEAAMIMCNLANVAPANSYKGQFADVSAEDKYANYIQSCLDYGFISKSTHFRPDDFLMGAELAKMILQINGHYVKKPENISYPNDILNMAHDIDLFKNSGTNGDTYVSRAQTAIIVYNALLTTTVDIIGGLYADSEQNLLNKNFKMSLMNGVITSNGVSRLDSALGGAVSKSITIGGKNYIDESGLAVNYLGENVYYLLSEDKSVISLWVNEKETKSVKINTSDIEYADFSRVEVLENNKTVKYQMKKNPYILVNDVADNSAPVSDLTCENGHLVLVDNNDDGVYDVVKIYKPFVAFIDSLSLDEVGKTFTVIDKQGNRNSYNYEVENTYKEDGSKAKIKEISVNQLVYIYAGGGGKTLKIQRMPVGFEGTVNGSRGDEIVIDGVEYEKTDYFKRLFPTVEIGSAFTFYKDLDGKIVYMTGRGTIKSSEMLAVILRVGISVVDDVNYVKVYNEDKQFKEYSFADKVRYDGSKYDLNGIETLGRSAFEGKLAKIVVNSNGRITSVVTEDYQQGEIYKSTKNLQDAKSAAAGFYVSNALVLPRSDNTPVFTIPVDESGKPRLESDYQEFYNVVDLVSKWAVKAEIMSDIPSIYGVDAITGEAVALVQRIEFNDSSSNHGIISDITNTTALVFEEANECVDDDGEIYYEINGYDLVRGTEKNIVLKTGITRAVNSYKIHGASMPNAFFEHVGEKRYLKQKVAELDDSYFIDITSLKRGDILRYAKGSFDSISELEYVGGSQVFADNKYGPVYSAGNCAGDIRSAFRIQSGKTPSVVDGRLKFKTVADNTEVDEIIKFSAFSGKVIVVEGKTVMPYNMSAAGAQIRSTDKIIVFSSGGYHQSIVIYR